VEVDVAEAKVFAIEFDSMRDANLTDRSAGPSSLNSLHDGFLRGDTFEHGVRANPISHRFDSVNALPRQCRNTRVPSALVRRIC